MSFLIKRIYPQVLPDYALIIFGFISSSRVFLIFDINSSISFIRKFTKNFKSKKFLWEDALGSKQLDR